MYDIFKKLQLDKKDAEVFMKLLELGAQPASTVAKACSLPRSSTYLILERLKSAGFVEQFQRAGVKYFKCIPLDDVPKVLNQKVQTIKTSIQDFKSQINDLKKLENRYTITPKIKIFEGKEQLYKVYEDLMREKEFSAIFNAELFIKIMPKYESKVTKAFKNNKSKVKELVVNNTKGKYYQNKYQSKNHQIKLLPKDFNLDSDVIITKEKVYMISYGANETAAVQIFNTALAQTQLQYFNFMWSKIS